MSFEFEDQSLQDNVSEARDGSQKFNKVSYTREFLLSLSQLEICKTLPTGFDRSILGEFEDTTKQKTSGPGSFPLLSSRRGDYSSSPPTRGDSSNYSRGIYGKWGSRSSGQSDRDSDSQSDRDSESSRHQGNASRRTWQSTDHDGLLGSGSLPRPSGYAAGMMASKVQGNDHFQLKKSNEPYHPPRPYKAVPHTRREISDSINDETFGSTDYTSEDRAEEERKRRASFELMRKEQQKVLQEKQKMHVDKQKDNFFTADAASLEQTTEGRALKQDGELSDSGSQPPSNTDSGNNPFTPHTSAPRPLVPPGFASTTLEKISGPKVITSTQEKVISKQELEETFLQATTKPVQEGSPNKQEERRLIHELVKNEQQPKVDLMAKPFSGLEVTNLINGNSSIVNTNKSLDDGEMIVLNTKKLAINNTGIDSNEDKSRSILDKLFGSSQTVNTSANLKELYDGKPDVKQIPNMAQSSKFSQWFLEDEKQPEHHTSVGPDDLLSLIVGGGKAGVQASDVEATQLIPPELMHQSSEFMNRLPSDSISSATNGIFEQSYNHRNIEAVPAVLTCEDLEGKILSEYSENSSDFQPAVFDNSATDAAEMQPKASVDSHASLHLLSLLQKGENLKDLTPSPVEEIGLSGLPLTTEVRISGTAIDKSRKADGEPLQDSGKNSTLEALFGTAFMKELQSVEAPVSVHRIIAGSAKSDDIEPHGPSFHVGNDGLRPATIDEIESHRFNFEKRMLASNSEQQTKPVETGSWLGHTDPRISIESLRMRNEVRAKRGLHGVVQSQLPEDESLLFVGDPLNPSKSRYIPDGNMNISEILSNTSFDIAEKLTALNAGYRDERSFRAQEGPHLNRGHSDPAEFERQYQNLHAKASPPQFHSPQMSHGRPLLTPPDYHPNHMTSQMRYMAPEGINHDGRINNQFPVNMIRPPLHHHNTAPTEFDLPIHHQMLQKMQVPQNFPPPNVLHEYPRGGPVPPHLSNQHNAFMQERNLMQGFPFGQRQPSISGRGMPLPAPDVYDGSNRPDPLQRLISIEHGANLRQVQNHGINGQGMYNHELDMSSPYR
ncbi:Uro-adherence factor A like [Heracleum sosnowskyi]|uniref:Uro-adherence factor A like n=1 Tax=Heracleum sosnowskyi TaxID=360622 RepID=A0AAD8MHG8_9APIA|nr:Uro-adherence factor A like [Heracleum sosnowskyi]